MKSLSLALVLILGLAFAGCSENASPKIYSATAEIQISPTMENESEQLLASEMGNEIETMKSPFVLLPVILNTKLNQVWSRRFKFGFDRFTMQEALDHLRQVLKFERISGTNIIKITGYSDVPNEAADIANAVADQYKARRDELHNDKALNEDSSKTVTEFVRKEIAYRQKKMEAERAAAEQNPHDVEALRESQSDQMEIDAMNAVLKKPTTDKEPEESPVRIVSRAVPPPE